MSWTSRSRVRVSDALAAALFAVAAFAPFGVASAATPVTTIVSPRSAAASASPRAPAQPEYWFSGARLIFQHARTTGSELAVATDDRGFGKLLRVTGSALSYDPTQPYLVITTADRRSIRFTIGDPTYTVGDVAEIAPFAPYTAGDVAFISLAALLQALHVAPVDSLHQTILQPQLSGIDVRSTALATIVTLHGATPIRFKRISDDGDPHVTLALLGVGTTLPGDRPVSGVGLTGISLAHGGTPRNPTVVLTFDTSEGGSAVLVPAESKNDLALAFAPEGTMLGGTAIPAGGSATLATEPFAAHAAHTNVPPPPPPLAAGDEPAAAASAGDDAGATSPPAQGDDSGPSTVATPISVAPVAPAAPAASGSSVTAIDYATEGVGLDVHVALSAGPVPFEYHRLPDDRWYVDLLGVALATSPIDELVSSSGVTSIRVKQLSSDGEPVTRIALSLTSPRVVSLRPSKQGFTISVDRLDDLDPQVSARGEIGPGALRTTDRSTAVAGAVTDVAPLAGGAAPDSGGTAAGTSSGAEGDTAAAVPALPSDGSDDGTTPWKFAPPVAGGGGRLIVIDPGHGGSDDGAAHNGLREKDLTLDLSRRLRAILVARGWRVKLTRDSDVDVFGVNASAHDELQARCDVANVAGARLFVSIHANSFTTSDLNGTTTYYYNGFSLPFAEDVHRRLMDAGLGTKNDGIRRENFYVIHHTTMPSILIESAFVSNPADAALLGSPAWRQKFAAGIAAGIADYAAANPASAAFSGAASGADAP